MSVTTGTCMYFLINSLSHGLICDILWVNWMWIKKERNNEKNGVAQHIRHYKRDDIVTTNFYLCTTRPVRHYCVVVYIQNHATYRVHVHAKCQRLLYLPLVQWICRQLLNGRTKSTSGARIVLKSHACHIFITNPDSCIDHDHGCFTVTWYRFVYRRSYVVCEGLR